MVNRGNAAKSLKDHRIFHFHDTLQHPYLNAGAMPHHALL
jgi:hypothetical protein